MKVRMTSFALALALLGAWLMLPGSAVAQTPPTNPFLDIPVSVTCPGGPVTGLLDYELCSPERAIGSPRKYHGHMPRQHNTI